MLENCQNTAGSTYLATDRRGHDGPLLTPSSYTCAISSASLFITLDSRYDGSSQAQRSIEGPRSNTLEILEFEYWTTSFLFMMNQQDRPSWIRWPVTYSVTPHLVRISHLHLATCTTMPPTDCHEHDALSQAL